jgi:hypothetical protein
VKIGLISLKRFKKQGEGIPKYAVMLYKYFIKIVKEEVIDKLAYNMQEALHGKNCGENFGGI